MNPARSELTGSCISQVIIASFLPMCIALTAMGEVGGVTSLGIALMIPRISFSAKALLPTIL